MGAIAYISSLADDVLSLFFPNLCITCGRNLVRNEKVICTFCEYELPQTGFHQHPHNPIEKAFWGKVEFERAASFLYFHKMGKVQELIHHLKYRERKDAGVWLGKKYGGYLKDISPFNKADYIIPVPLHAAKQRKRGYNQADCFAEGLSEAMNIPWRKDILKRVTATESQTRKTRLERQKNVENIFECVKPNEISGKRILLVDDVLTTGATLESCGLALHKAGNIKLNFATIACA